MMRVPQAGMVLLTAVVAGGCTSPGPADQAVRLAPLATPFERDIPVPIGFRFVETSSEDRSTGTMRLYLRHMYEGDAAKIAVRNFYREQMPLARWTKVSDGNDKGEYTLRYIKAEEVCTVRIRKRQGMRSGSEVQVTVSPEHKGAPPPGARRRS